MRLFTHSIVVAALLLAPSLATAKSRKAKLPFKTEDASAFDVKSWKKARHPDANPSDQLSLYR
jgi:hypothetical protein